MSGEIAASAVPAPPSVCLGHSRTGERWRPIAHVAGRGVLYVALPLALVAVWQALFSLGLIRPILLPPPTTVAATFWALTVSGDLPYHVAVSLRRVLEGFLIAASLALPLGVGIGISRTLDHVSDLLIQLVKPIPPSRLTPHSCIQLAPCGRGAKPVRCASHTAPKIPSCLPSTSPPATAHVRGANVLPLPSIRTPALARPNSGTMA